MRPYLAIIKDSFAEALASRVLWILLILITLGLLILLPLGYRAEQTTKFQYGDFRDPRAFVKEVREQYERGDPSPGQRIWSNLEEETQKQLGTFSEGDKDSESGRSGTRKLVEALNELLDEEELYDEESWQDELLDSETRELLGQSAEQRGQEDLARLNRLLIEQPFDDYFRPQPPKQIVITYFGAKISPAIRISEKRVKQFIAQIILPALIGFLVGFVAVLTAILVTAPIIPQMFDPGALSLLLSKPLSRSMMFLSKFAGGCAFILINVTYLIIGLWAIVGWRFGIWNQGLLLCIPIFLFLFAIYYSISAISGVIWRNAVVSIVMTVLFWFVCTVVGVAKGVFEQFAVETQRIVHLVNADEALFALDEQGVTKQWNQEAEEWDEVFIERSIGPMQRILGPIYDPEGRQLLAAHVGSRGLFGSGPTLLIGRQSENWVQEDGPGLPDGTFELLPHPNGRLLAVSEGGINELTDDLQAEKEKLQLFFMEIPQSFGQPFRSLGPKSPLKLDLPASAAVDQTTANIAVYCRGRLLLLKRERNQYKQVVSVEIDADKEEGAALAFGGNTILLALADGRVLNFEAPALNQRHEYVPEELSQPRFVSASHDGRWFAVVFHNGRLHLLDTTQPGNAGMSLADITGQGDVSAASFASDNTILVADRAKRVTEYELDSLNRKQVYSPSLTALEMAYYYAITPIYTVFPKPGELDNTIQYVLKKEETTDLGIQAGNLQAKRVRLRPWAPVRSSFIFMVIVLFFACVYIERQDF